MKKLLLTREDSADDEKFFVEKGYHCKVLPLSQLVLRELTATEIAQIHAAEWLFFTSSTPVAQVLKVAKSDIRIAVIGSKTAQAVRNCGFQIAVQARATETKHELLKAWSRVHLSPTRIFYPKSNLADDFLESFLDGRHEVFSATTYENQLPAGALTTLEKVLSNAAPDAVYFASPSAWQRFYSVYKKFQSPLTFIAIGTSTAAAIEKEGYQPVLKKDL